MGSAGDDAALGPPLVLRLGFVGEFDESVLVPVDLQLRHHLIGFILSDRSEADLAPPPIDVGQGATDLPGEGGNRDGDSLAVGAIGGETGTPQLRGFAGDPMGRWGPSGILDHSISRSGSGRDFGMPRRQSRVIGLCYSRPTLLLGDLVVAHLFSLAGYLRKDDEGYEGWFDSESAHLTDSRSDGDIQKFPSSAASYLPTPDGLRTFVLPGFTVRVGSLLASTRVARALRFGRERPAQNLAVVEG